jgi:glycosyltransferase involved in cell wall biosynthesis
VRVLIDATAIPADRGGVGRYLDDLVPALAATSLEVVVVAQQRDVAGFAAAAPRARVVAAPAAASRRPVRMLWEQTALPLLARRTRSDVLLSPHYTAPALSPVPIVVTLHDATFFSHPGLHTPLKRRFFRAATRLAVRRAAALVVPSRATRDEVVRFAGGDPGRFVVAYHGVDADRFHPVGAAEVARARAAAGVPGPYVAFLGTVEPRKNVPALIRGWVAAVEGLPAPPALVIAGARGWDAEVDAEVERVPAHLQLVRTGYLPLADLAGFLAGSEVVAYPSLGEGFGLPVLEAMACGAAVLTTDRLSLPEVGGDAVAYTGTAADEIAHALRDLLADPERRRELGTAARRRAATFTWAESAAAHVRAFDAAVGGRGGQPRTSDAT